VRREIAASWMRSQLLGVKRELPVEAIAGEPLFDADERLRRGVEPVLDELATRLAGTNSAILLADHRAVVLDRRATTRTVLAEMDRLSIVPGMACREGNIGTNAVGTALEERRLVRVAGAEHYAEAFQHLSCYGVPLVHPLSRRLVGVLDLTFPQCEEHPLMASFMADAGRRIEGLLAEWASLRERAQFDCFLELTRRSRRPVLSTMDHAVLLNRSARELNPVDQAALLRAASELAEVPAGTVISLLLSGDEEPTSIRVHAQSDDARFPGVVLEVVSSSRPRSTARPARRSLPDLVGTSAAWEAFCSQALQASATEAPILVGGEGGSGKLAVACALHQLAARPRLEILDVATVLTDGHPTWLRALRRALDDGTTTVVVRHLEFADRALSAAIAAELDRMGPPGSRVLGTLTTGPFPHSLEGLLSRFCCRLSVPPLRDRRNDIPGLVLQFVERHAAQSRLRFHPETLAVLRSAEFADNVRQLETLVAGITGSRRSGDVLPTDLPALTLAGPSHLTPIERAERDTIVKALREAKGNKAAAASALGISRPTLYKRIALYEIESPFAAR
jgi:sigma-54 dependent transcriptional regulator, acetoin dehydrogenase operon transcriptional activator AcoR